MSQMIDYNTQDPLENLNDRQRSAVETLSGPVLVLAGAGTGKTRVLTTRFAALVSRGLAWPSQILCVTFTNKAAGEMKERIAKLLGGDVPMDGLWLGTFHSLSARILRRFSDRVGLPQAFTILDTDDQLRLIKQLVEERGLDPKKHPPKKFAWLMDDWKNRALTPDSIPAEEGRMAADGLAAGIYTEYQRRLLQMGACDFGDLLLHVVTMLRNPANADVLSELHRRFKYVMVDEYQDTNVAQYLWLRLLVGAERNICCVGDDDQSIYGWRGAEVGNILRFEKDFEGATVVRLEQNYRSTGHILGAAATLIANNSQRFDKTLWTNDDLGHKVFVQALWDGEAEARWVTEKLEKLRGSGDINSYDDAAILVRASHQMRAFEESFLKRGLPYRVIGGPRFYERQEIRDAVAYMRIVMQPNDDLALERIINLPKRGVGAGTIEKLYANARAAQTGLYAALKSAIAAGELRGQQREHLAKFVAHIDAARESLSTTEPHVVIETLLQDVGYLDMWKAEKTEDARGRLENLDELLRAISEHAALADFLEQVALVAERNGDAGGMVEAVTLMTLHAAKGLEFPVVFLAGWEEGLFPNQRAMDENGQKGLEEERRLAYVGITRARERAFITYAANRQTYGTWLNSISSRFVDELPDEHTEIGSNIGLHAAGRSIHWDSSGYDAPAPRAAAPVAPKTSDAPTHRGKKVRHETFGEGVVIHADGNKLDIRFADGMTRRLLAGFVTFV